MIKAIFFDIDGTLVSFKTHLMPESTRRSLDRLRAKGILTFVATGRHMSDIVNLGDWLPDGYVTLNGGYCMVDGEVVHKRSVHPDDIAALADRLESDKFFPFIFIDKERLCMNYADERVRETLEMIDIGAPPIASLDEVRRMEIFQMLGFFGPEEEGDVMKLLPHCHTTRWTELFTDIIPVGTDKWDGISRVIERFGITRGETMAFGDGGNDVSMIRGAGIGVAMGNADDHVKDEADWVTASVDEDGITKALEHFGIL